MRIFTFGCSYTKYYWPTWADILRYNYGADVVYNYAHSGAGIGQIMYNIQMADTKHNFNPDTDKIVIQWTQFGREDRYIKEKWSAGGGLPNATFDTEWVRKYHDFEFDFICSITMIKTINAAYSNLIKYQYHWNLPEGFHNQTVLTSPLQKKLVELYRDDFPALFDVYSQHEEYPNTRDGHPTVGAHLKKSKQVVEQLGIEPLSQKTEKTFIELDQWNLSLCKNKTTVLNQEKTRGYSHLHEGRNLELRDPDQENLKLWSIENL